MCKKIPFYKRVGALFTCFALVCGMFSMIGTLPASAKSVETFKADFSALPTGEVSMTDTEAVEYLENLFDFYYFQEGWYFQRPDVNGYVVDAEGNNLTSAQTEDTAIYLPDVVDKAAASASAQVDGAGSNLGWIGFSTWKVQGKYLGCACYSGSDAAVFRKYNSMWVKAADGNLASLNNFNLEMDFSPAQTALASNGTLGDGKDSLAITFRARGAGNIRSADQQVVSISPDGSIFVGDLAGAAFSGYTETMTYKDAAVTLTRGADYHLSMRVVGTQMVLTISLNGKTVYETTRTVEYLGNGYIGIGGSNAGAYYGNIEITRLDKDGNPVDFNDHNDGYGFGADFGRLAEYRDGKVDASDDRAYYGGTYFRDLGTAQEWLSPVEYGSKTYDFADPATYATDQAVVDYLNERFDFYYNRQSVFTQYATPYENSVVQDADGNNGKTAQWKLQNGNFLNGVFTGGEGLETFRKIVSIVPKNDSGAAVTAKNLETEFDINIASSGRKGVAFTFRAATPGKYTSAHKVSVDNKITVFFRANGWKLYEGAIPADDLTSPANSETFNKWAYSATVTKAHVYIKAVNDTFFMKVTGADGTVYYEGTTAIAYDASGSMFYSVLNGTGGFANIRANRLGDNGEVIPWNTSSSLTAFFDAEKDEGQYTHTITSTDDEWYKFIDERFNTYYDLDGTLEKRAPISTAATKGAVWKSIYETKYLVCSYLSNTNKVSYLKSVGLLVPKTADGNEAVLKNFELSFTTRWSEATYNNDSVGSLVIGFRQQTAGKITTGAGQVNKEQGLIVISPKGISIAGGDEITDNMYGLDDEQTFATGLNDGNKSLHLVTVRVVGNEVTVTIGSNTYTDTVNYTEPGYLAFGPGAFRMNFKDITVTRLDDDGNAIDWNGNQYAASPTTVTVSGGHLLGFNTTTTNKFPNGKSSILLNDATLTVAQRAEFLEFINNRFDVYYNDNDGTYIAEDSVAGNTVGYNYDEMSFFTHKWLRPNAAASGYGEIKTNSLEDIGSLVFKDDDGEQLYLKNLEINTAFEHEGTSATGSSFIAVRQETPGKYFNDDGTLANGTFMQFSNGYVYVYENGVKLHEQYCEAAVPASVMKVNVRVVGNQLTYTLTDQYKNTGSSYTGTVTLSSARYGYVAFSQNNWRQFYSLSNTSITALDNAGNPTPIKKQESKYRGGDVQVNTTVNDGVYTNVITVTPDDGFELLAGSLVATDAKGNRYTPTRVGFREDGNANEYVVTCESAVNVTATFIQPSASTPNIGNIGTSVKAEIYGLRFVSRFTRFVEEGVEYVTLDGAKYPVKDYGMLVGLKKVIEDATLDLELSESNQYVQKFSAHDQQKYYDLCDEYVDMSVCVTNMHQVSDGLSLDVVARPYVIVDDGSEEGMPLYAEQFSSNYEYSAGIKTTTFTELFENEQVIRLGRAAVVDGEYQMDWVNTGFEVSGNLVGSVKVQMQSERENTLLNVSVDGGDVYVVRVPQGVSTVTLASDLLKGPHTIKVISGSSVRWGTMSALSLQYTGVLDTVEREDSKLRLMVLGDSISCAYGMGALNGVSYTSGQLIELSNAYNSYAAITARNLDAYLDVIARCGFPIDAPIKYVKDVAPLNPRSGSPDCWNWEEQDVIVVNLGTNDEISTSRTPETVLETTTTLLEGLRELNPNAYIIYVYGMMHDYEQQPEYTDYLVSYKSVVQSMVDKGDDRIFMLGMTANIEGYATHPDTEAQAEAAEILTAFIREKCSDHFGHTTHTETIGALETADKVIFSGRTAASGTARTMTYSNTGITIEGYLYGDLKMNVNVASTTCALNVIVDGDVQNATTVWVDAGSKEVTLIEDLRRGHHTIQILKGTAHHAGLLTMKDITYTGTLDTPTAKDLQIEFIGDSVTVGEGIYGSGITPTAKSYNSIDGYAMQVGNYLGAGVSTIAQCGMRIPDMTTQFNNWTDFENTQKDIVVINLGTNDFGWAAYADYDITTAYYPESTGYSSIKMKDAITGLIEDVRGAYPDAYIIWTYGMMWTRHTEALAGIIDEYATQTSDEKLLYCDLSAAKDNTGNGSHPSTIGNNNAAILLTSFIRENCADLVPSVPEVQKTYATDRVLKVACVGDSITAGGYWEDNMRGQLSTDNYEVQGFGVSGSTALFKGVDGTIGKAYVDQEAYTNALAYGADAVVIMLGTNDSKVVNWPVYADEFIDNYTEIVRSFQNSETAPKVFIALPPTVYINQYQDINNTRIEDFVIPALGEVAARTGAVIIDTHTATGGDSTLMYDGIHPNDTGRQVLCETIAPVIIADTGRQ